MTAKHELLDRLKRERVWAALLFVFAAALIALVQYVWAPKPGPHPVAPSSVVDVRESAG